MNAAVYQDEIEISPLKGSNLKGKIGVPTSLRVLKDGDSIAPHERMIRIMTIKDGDKRIVWDCRDLDQINEAKDMFDECVQQGLVPYKVGVDGKATSEVMEEFDPSAEEVIFLPIGLVAGG